MTAPKQALKSLTFTALPKREANPVQERRAKTIARLEEQKLLFSNPNFTRTVRASVRNEDGVRTIVEKQQRVAPWWVQLADGSYLFTIRSGWKPIEFDKGKSAIVVLSHDKLPAIIDTLIVAVRNGELDQQLAQGSKLGMAKAAVEKRSGIADLIRPPPIRQSCRHSQSVATGLWLGRASTFDIRCNRPQQGGAWVSGTSCGYMGAEWRRPVRPALCIHSVSESTKSHGRCSAM